MVVDLGSRPAAHVLPPLVAALALLAVAQPAGAGVRMATRDVAVPAAARSVADHARVLPVRTAPFRFNLVGLHWQGSGRVAFRTGLGDGAFGPWHDGLPEADDLPDRGSAERRRSAGWRLGSPYWTDAATRIQVRVSGRVDRVRAYFLRSPVRSAPRVSARVVRPSIITRKAWGADESIVRARPQYAPKLAFAVVHHTAGGQPSTPAESAAMVRGIQAYHVKSNGWNDIGYNFLVDRFGELFEGRGGGITRNVIGAHAEGFNTGSVGVAVIGTYDSSTISSAARAALVRLVSWRLDRAHVNPLGHVTRRSYGNPRFPYGTPVRLRRISGHRDTGWTSCPGGALYARLPGIARDVRALGLPKIYAPRARGGIGGAVRFTATVDPARDWKVTVTNATGMTVARHRGSGSRIDWTWKTTAVPSGAYRWTMEAGMARPATGRVDSGSLPPPPLALTVASADPGTLTPNRDGVRDTSMLTWKTSRSAELRVRVLDTVETLVATAVPWTDVTSGTGEHEWDGTAADGTPVPDGAYVLRFAARTATERVHRDVPVVVDRTLGSLELDHPVFSPNHDGYRDSLGISFRLAHAADVLITVVGGGSAVATVFGGDLGAGAHSFTWNGVGTGGTVVPNGSYKIRVQAVTDLGTRRLAADVGIDTKSPPVRNAVARRTATGTRVTFTLGETAYVHVWFGDHLVRLGRLPAGPVTIRRARRPSEIRIRARDAAWNRTVVKLKPS